MFCTKETKVTQKKKLMFYNLVLNLIKRVFVYLFDCKTNGSNYAKIIKFKKFPLLSLKIYSLITFKTSKE